MATSNSSSSDFDDARDVTDTGSESATTAVTVGDSRVSHVVVLTSSDSEGDGSDGSSPSNPGAMGGCAPFPTTVPPGILPFGLSASAIAIGEVGGSVQRIGPTQKHYHGCHFYGSSKSGAESSRSADPVHIHVHHHVHNHFSSRANTALDIDMQMARSPFATTTRAPPESRLEGGEGAQEDRCGEGDTPSLSPSSPIQLDALEYDQDGDVKEKPSPGQSHCGSADSSLRPESGYGEEPEDGHASECRQENEGEFPGSPVPKRRTMTPPPPPQKLRRMTRHISD